MDSKRDRPDDDNHPYIVKDRGVIELPENGYGYELFHAMRRHSKKIAQVDEEGDYQTFEEILRDSISVAKNLQKKGLDEDSLICLCTTNTKYSCMPYLAGLFIGCKMNALDISIVGHDIVFLLKITMPDIMFVQKEKVPEIEEALQEIGLKTPIVVIGGEVQGHESFQDYLIASNDEIENFRPYKVDTMRRNCAIIYSSGTSGLPKAICLNHYNMLAQVLLLKISEIPLRVVICFASYYWISSLISLGYCTIAGITRVVAKQFNAVTFYQLIDKYKIESAYLGLFPCICLTKTPKPPDVDISSLRVLRTGGEPLSPIIFNALRKVFPGCMVSQVYGQTECVGLIVKWSMKNPEDVALLSARPTSSGRPYGGFWYKIVDEETKEIVGPNKTGELYVKSNYLVMNGYYKQDSSECFDESGWLRTGDLAYFDDDHCLYVVDRLKGLIKYRGWHIPPIILEDALIGHPAVDRAVVIGVPNQDDGEHPVGLIILKEGVNPETVNLDEIAEFANKQMVDEGKCLRGGVRIIHSIPLTTTGKVNRRSLRESFLYGEDLSMN